MDRLLLVAFLFSFSISNGMNNPQTMRNAKERLTSRLIVYKNAYTAYVQQKPMTDEELIRRSDNIDKLRRDTEVDTGLNLGHPYSPEKTNPTKYVYGLPVEEVKALIKDEDRPQ